MTHEPIDYCVAADHVDAQDMLLAIVNHPRGLLPEEQDWYDAIYHNCPNAHVRHWRCEMRTRRIAEEQRKLIQQHRWQAFHRYAGRGYL